MGAGLKVYVTVFLFCGQEVLLLERGQDKVFAPGRWTGVGGRVVPEELADLNAAALREVYEETGIEAADVEGLTIRVVLTQPEGGDVVTLIFLAGHTTRRAVGPCDEGRLQWVARNRVVELDLIENARYALELAVQAEQDGAEGVFFGVCEPEQGGRLRSITVASEAYGL